MQTATHLAHAICLHSIKKHNTHPYRHNPYGQPATPCPQPDHEDKDSSGSSLPVRNLGSEATGTVFTPNGKMPWQSLDQCQLLDQ